MRHNNNNNNDDDDDDDDDDINHKFLHRDKHQKCHSQPFAYFRNDFMNIFKLTRFSLGVTTLNFVLLKLLVGLAFFVFVVVVVFVCSCCCCC